MKKKLLLMVSSFCIFCLVIFGMLVLGCNDSTDDSVDNATSLKGVWKGESMTIDNGLGECVTIDQNHYIEISSDKKREYELGDYGEYEDKLIYCMYDDKTYSADEETITLYGGDEEDEQHRYSVSTNTLTMRIEEYSTEECECVMTYERASNSDIENAIGDCEY